MSSIQDSMQDIAKLIDQRDELLAALKEARRWIGDGPMSECDNRKYWTAGYAKLVDDTDAIISKCEA